MTKIEFIESCLERKLTPLEIELINKLEVAPTKIKDIARKDHSNFGYSYIAICECTI